jgi:hypothetical protein
MNTHKQTRFEALVARISRGAVPIDGIYWLDPKDARVAGAMLAKSAKRAAAPERDSSPVSLPLSRLLRRS